MVDNLAESPKILEKSVEVTSTPPHPVKPWSRHHPITRHYRGEAPRTPLDYPERDIQDDRETGSQSVSGRPDVKLNLYKGPGKDALQRGIKKYESYLRLEGGIVDVKDLFVSTLEAARAAKRDMVTIFDFGCGEGNMIKELAEDPEIMRVVQQYPDIQVSVVGLTDSAQLPDQPTDEEKINGRNIVLPEDAPENISGRIDFYAVTAARTLKQYFEKKGIESIDLAFAVQSLRYLPAKNFDEVVTTIADKLVPSGRMLASHFSNPPYPSNGDYLSIQVRSTGSSPKTEASFFDRMTKQGDRLEFGSEEEVVQELAELQQALEYFRDKGVVSQARIDDTFDKLIPEETRLSNHQDSLHPQSSQIVVRPVGHHTRRDLRKIVYLLENVEGSFAKSRYDTREEQKRAVLTRLSTRPGVTVTAPDDRETFDIRKDFELPQEPAVVIKDKKQNWFRSLLRLKD